MTVERKPLLAALKEACVGLTEKEMLEQSNCFIFKEGLLLTFNDEVMYRCQSPLGEIEAIVNATDLLGVISRIPDDTVEIERVGEELLIRGKRRRAGIGCAAELHLPIQEVPKAEKFTPLADGVIASIKMAAETCGGDNNQHLTTFVHVSSELIEGCDNSRLLRIRRATGFPKRVLLPAGVVHKLCDLDLRRVAIGEGWVHFRTADKAEVSLRCSHEEYLKGLDAVLKMEKGVSLTLPGSLKEMIERAEVFKGGSYDSRVRIRIGAGKLLLRSQKEGGWYEERKKIEYQGSVLEFDVNPQFLTELLGRTRSVEADGRKMKAKFDDSEFVVALQPGTDDSSEEATDSDEE